jgi:hypothetical protein
MLLRKEDAVGSPFRASSERSPAATVRCKFCLGCSRRFTSSESASLLLGFRRTWEKYKSSLIGVQ